MDARKKFLFIITGSLRRFYKLVHITYQGCVQTQYIFFFSVFCYVISTALFWSRYSIQGHLIYRDPGVLISQWWFVRAGKETGKKFKVQLKLYHVHWKFMSISLKLQLHLASNFQDSNFTKRGIFEKCIIHFLLTINRQQNIVILKGVIRWFISPPCHF